MQNKSAFKVGDKVNGSFYGIRFSGEVTQRISSYTEGVSRYYRADLDVSRSLVKLDNEIDVGGMRNEITIEDADARGERTNMVLA